MSRQYPSGRSGTHPKATTHLNTAGRAGNNGQGPISGARLKAIAGGAPMTAYEKSCDDAIRKRVANPDRPYEI